MKKIRADFEKGLTDIVNKIVHGYSPEKIILFGSLSMKNVKNPGDIDLIVIKSTDQDPWERAASVDKIMDHKFPLDILIYTPEEIRKRRAIHDEFVEEFSVKGKVVYDGQERI